MNERNDSVDFREIQQYPYLVAPPGLFAAPADMLNPYEYTKEANDGPNRVTALRPNIVTAATEIYPKASKEYSRSYIQYFGNHSIDIKVLMGEGLLLLQRQAIDNQGHPLSDIIEDFSVISVQKGNKLTIPPYYYIQFVNTAKRVDYFTIEDDGPAKVNDKNLLLLPEASTYELIKSQGFAYDIIKGTDGNPALKKNKSYREIKQEFLGDLSII